MPALQSIHTDDAWLKRELGAVVDRLYWKAARKDVRPFAYAADRPSLDLRERDFILDIVNRITSLY